jgi:hypothetical protein
MMSFDLSSREKLLRELNGKLVSAYNKMFTVQGPLMVYKDGLCSVHSIDRESQALFKVEEVTKIESEISLFTNAGTVVAQIEVL